MSQYPPQGPPPITTQPTCKLSIYLFINFESQKQNPQFSAITVIAAPQLGPGPLPMTCPVCQSQIMTDVSDVAIAKTHAFAIAICCLGGMLGCCLIPYCVSSCQGQQHACPNCRHSIGLYK